LDVVFDILAVEDPCFLPGLGRGIDISMRG